ncbi:MAG: archease [Burkholderiales bacterium]|nr:archease [Burkholderiales bacterium]
MHDYFEHDADIGIIGRGNTVEEAFVSAARALFSLESDPEQLGQDVAIGVEFSEEDLEYAFITWLNLLIAKAHSERIALREFSLSREGSRWKGIAWGERWKEEMERGIEVKGATLTLLSVKKSGNLWEARSIVDV